MKTFALVLIGFGMVLPLAAQTEGPRAQAYGYFGLMGDGGTTFGKLLNPGFGFDIFAYRGLAGSVDLGYLGYYADFRAAGFGLFSPNVSYHFLRNRKLVPFVTGGYSLAFRNGTASLGNYGGGINYWFARHVGLRVEGRGFRDGNGYDMGGLRAGISFR